LACRRIELANLLTGGRIEEQVARAAVIGTVALTQAFGLAILEAREDMAAIERLARSDRAAQRVAAPRKRVVGEAVDGDPVDRRIRDDLRFARDRVRTVDRRSTFA